MNLGEIALLEAGLPLPSEPATLWYLGDDFRRLHDLRRVLPSGWREGPAAEMVHQAALGLREDYRNLDTVLGVDEAGRFWWDASTIAERNPTSSHVLLNAARTALLDHLRTEGGRHVVVTEDIRFLALATRRLGRKLGWKLRLRIFVQEAGFLLRGLLATLSSAGRLIWRIHTLRRQRRDYPLPLEGLRRSDVLLISWAKPTTFDDSSSRRDTYLAEVPGVLVDAGYAVGHLHQPIWWTSGFTAIVNALVRSKTPALVGEDLLRPADVLAAWVQALAQTRRFHGLLRGKSGPLVEAVRLEIALQAASGGSIVPLAFRCIGKRLANLGIRPRIVLHSYENQPWEKTLRLGLRESLADSRVVGMLHAPFPRIDVCWGPGVAEVRSRRLPDLLLTHGREGTAQLRDWGVPADRVAMVGAWRFANMIEVPPPPPGPLRILCCTSMDWNEAVELTGKAVCATSGLEGVRLVVNFHPVTGESFRRSVIDAVKQSVDCSIEDVDFTPKGVRELLADCSIVVYDKSSAAFDAAWNGRVLVHAASEVALDSDTMLQGLAYKARTALELRALLRRLVEEAPRPDPGVNRQRLQECMAPPDHEAFLAAIQKLTGCM